MFTNNIEYSFDDLVFATGFDAMTGAVNAIEILNDEDVSLKSKWSDGPKTYLGMMVSNFPNLFMITGPQSPGVKSQMILSIEQHVDWLAELISYMKEHQYSTIETSSAVEDEWIAHVNEVAQGTMFTAKSCNSWYLGANIPGKPRIFMPYVGGVGEYRKKCDEVAAAGYEGFSLRA